jgi:hypothetical protein
MKKFACLTIAAAALALSACAHDERPDTRAQSYQRADLDQNEKLTLGEYETYLQMQADMGDGRAQELLSYEQKNRPKAVLLKFQKLDMNRDTFVSREELDF